jgi:hypothetical protein
MGKLYRSREGEVTAVDTKTQLATLGSESAPGPLLVPNAARNIKQVIMSAVGNISAANDCGFIVRLEGPGLMSGPEVLTAGATADQVATGANMGRDAVIVDVDIPVAPNQEILIFGEMTGEDIGAAQFGVTLVFGV